MYLIIFTDKYYIINKLILDNLKQAQYYAEYLKGGNPEARSLELFQIESKVMVKKYV